jgi:predicted lipase
VCVCAPIASLIAVAALADLKNWLSNLKFDVVPYMNVTRARVHEGFFGSYNSMKSDLFAALNNVTALFPGWPIAFTGHSMGGSNALFATLDAVDRYGATHNISLTTFGQPRTGNDVFALYAAQVLNRTTSLFRVVHNRDPVAHVPPLTIDNYFHLPTEVFYDSNMLRYKVCDSSGEDPLCR